MTYMHLISLVLRGLRGTQDSEIFMALTRLCVALQLCHVTQTVCVCGCCYNYCVYCSHVWTVVSQIKLSKEIHRSLLAVNCSHDDLELMWPLLQKVRWRQQSLAFIRF